MTRSERRKHNNTYIGTEVRCRNAGNPGRRCKIRIKVKSGVARRSLLWGAAHLPVSARVRGWLTSSHDSFPIPYLGCCTFHYFPCTVFTPNFFLCGTPFAKCCTFLSHLPIHVQRGNSSISGWFWNHKQTNLHFSVLPCICWNVKCQMTKSKLAIWGMAAHVPGWSSGSCSIMGGTLTLKAISPFYRYSSSSKDYF